MRGIRLFVRILPCNSRLTLLSSTALFANWFFKCAQYAARVPPRQPGSIDLY
jgi:hypothetical protein